MYNEFMLCLCYLKMIGISISILCVIRMSKLSLLFCLFIVATSMTMTMTNDDHAIVFRKSEQN
ncbi:MAG: hypothetical protein ACI90V_010324 [Bacillariaceae sp.]|jgi:hypothetical protein